jgi:hypothetical protein
MPDYTASKIYKIESLEGGLIYYGSTVQPLTKRLSQHRARQDSSSRLVVAFPDATIILVEDCPCENVEQLKARESHYIRNNPCVNKAIPLRTPAEYYRDNRAGILAKKRVYDRDNAKIISAKRSVKIQCECGTEISKRNLARHKKSAKHRFKLAELNK